jgi:hypothetical protein
MKILAMTCLLRDVFPEKYKVVAAGNALYLAVVVQKPEKPAFT